MTKRLVGIELYRVLLTFGICYLHAITMCGHRADGVGGRISYLLYSCVVGFVFVSGWFGIKFNVLKLLKLWGVAVYAAVVVSIIDFTMQGRFEFGMYYDILIGNWFLNGYTVLMLMAPTVNLLISGVSTGSSMARAQARTAIVLLLSLVFGWAFLRTCPFVSRYVPSSAGVLDYSGLTLVGIYTAARLCNVFSIDSRISIVNRCVIVFVCLAAIMCHMSSYASPFAFGLALSGFLIFKNVRLVGWPERFVMFCSPTMFSIFLFHANFVGFRLMGECETKLLLRGYNINLVFPVVAGMAFIVGMFMDCPRRLGAMLFNKALQKV